MDLDEKTISGVVDVCLWAADFSYKKKKLERMIATFTEEIIRFTNTAEMVILDYPI